MINRAEKLSLLSEMIAFEHATGQPLSKVPQDYWADESPLDNLLSNFEVL